MLTSIDQDKLLHDIRENKDEVIKIRVKMFRELKNAVTFLLDNCANRDERTAHRSFLMNKINMFCMVCHQYSVMADKWERSGKFYESNVARSLCEFERMQVYEYDRFLYNNGI